MKAIIFLFFILVMYATVAKAGLPPTTAAGQNQSNITTFNFKVPNNLATNIGGGTLLESGNSNILVNPSFEHQAGDTGWTLSGTAGAGSETIAAIHGKKSWFFNATTQTIDLVQSSTLYQAQFSDGVQGLASIRVKTNHTGTCSVCSVQAGTVSTTNCVSVQANNKWGLYKVPMILGATSNGISLACTSGTGLTYVDDAFVGAVDLKADVDQSRIAGESYFAATTACANSTTSSSLAALSNDTDCPGPTVVRQRMGSWQTTDANNLIQTINNLPAGDYVAEFELGSYMASAANSALAINDGTTTCASTPSGSSATVVGKTVSCSFSYNTAGNRSFQLYGATNGGTLTISQDDTTNGRSNVRFKLYYFGSGSVYTSTNADTDWASCGHTTSDFTGFGTVTNIETQCKREGSDLLMRGRFVVGTPSSVEARLALKLNGVALTSASSSTITNLQLAGSLYQNFSNNTYYGNTVLIEPSVGYVTFANVSNSTNGLTKGLGSATFGSSALASITARIPISGWNNSNIIIGQFNEVMVTPNVTKPKTCYYAFGGASATLASPTECTVGACVEVVDTCGTVTVGTSNFAGSYIDFTFANGTFSSNSPVHCTCTAYDTTFNITKNCVTLFQTGDSTWSSNSNGGYVANMATHDNVGAFSSSYVQLKCEGQAP